MWTKPKIQRVANLIKLAHLCGMPGLEQLQKVAADEEPASARYPKVAEPQAPAEPTVTRPRTLTTPKNAMPKELQQREDWLRDSIASKDHQTPAHPAPASNAKNMHELPPDPERSLPQGPTSSGKGTGTFADKAKQLASKTVGAVRDFTPERAGGLMQEHTDQFASGVDAIKGGLGKLPANLNVGGVPAGDVVDDYKQRQVGALDSRKAAVEKLVEGWREMGSEMGEKPSGEQLKQIYMALYGAAPKPDVDLTAVMPQMQQDLESLRGGPADDFLTDTGMLMDRANEQSSAVLPDTVASVGAKMKEPQLKPSTVPGGMPRVGPTGPWQDTDKPLDPRMQRPLEGPTAYPPPVPPPPPPNAGVADRWNDMKDNLGNGQGVRGAMPPPAPTGNRPQPKAAAAPTKKA